MGHMLFDRDMSALQSPLFELCLIYTQAWCICMCGRRGGVVGGTYQAPVDDAQRQAAGEGINAQVHQRRHGQRHEQRLKTGIT